MIDNYGDEVTTTGNGYHQLSSGVDFWWGMPYIQFGGAQFFTYSFPRFPMTNVNNQYVITKRIRDLQYTTILTVGHPFIEHNVQIQGGIIFDYIGQEHNSFSDGTFYDGSAEQSNTLFATLNWNLTKIDLIRFLYSYGGAIPGDVGPYTNSNQTISSMLLIGYERTFF